VQGKVRYVVTRQAEFPVELTGAGTSMERAAAVAYCRAEKGQRRSPSRLNPYRLYVDQGGGSRGGH
jgi:hypothetical protein